VEDFDPMTYKNIGFHGVISMLGTHADREELRESLKDWRYEEEINKRSVDVDSALNLVLSQVDRIARDLKRGVKNKFDSLPFDFINTQTDFDDELQNRYFSKLEKKTSISEPENAKGIQIPDVILKKNLPKLLGNKYSGTSQRVWKMLLKKHGVKDDPQDIDPKTATDMKEEDLTTKSNAPQDTEKDPR
jgi:hypothetical protein